VNQYDLIIREYLEEQKSVSFEKIGSLVFAGKNTPDDLPLPPGSLQFTYNKKAVTSPELIDFIARRLSKNRGLIQSDLESYIELMRQFINIGKPYEMESIGVFKLAKTNEYEFTPLDLTFKKEEQKNIKKQQPGNNSQVVVKRRTNRSALMLLAMLIVLAVLGVITWGIYNLFIAGSSKPDATDTLIEKNALTQPVDTGTVTNNVMPKDTMAGIKNDTMNYKFIYETTSSAMRAYTRTNQLKKFGNPAALDSIATDTAKVYQLYFKMRLYYADTARIRDSLQKHLQRSIKIVPDKQAMP